jgi:hypothetical protein
MWAWGHRVDLSDLTRGRARNEITPFRRRAVTRWYRQMRAPIWSEPLTWSRARSSYARRPPASHTRSESNVTQMRRPRANPWVGCAGVAIQSMQHHGMAPAYNPSTALDGYSPGKGIPASFPADCRRENSLRQHLWSALSVARDVSPVCSS